MVRLSIALLLVACSARHDAPAAGSAAAAVETSKAPAVGAHAPSVQLTAMTGERVGLDSVLSAHDKTIVVFYRGFY